MGFSREAGPEEGAVLIIANTAKQARKLAWQGCFLGIDDWLDQAVRLIRDESALLLANQTKLKADEPHVVDSPLHCEACGWWGAGLTEDQLCGNCNEHPGDDLVKRLGVDGRKMPEM